MLISIIRDAHAPKIQCADCQDTLQKAREQGAFIPSLETGVRLAALHLQRMHRLLYKREEGDNIIFLSIHFWGRWGVKRTGKKSGISYRREFLTVTEYPAKLGV